MKSKLGKLSMALGMVCILAAAGLMTYNYYDEKRAAESSEELSQMIVQYMILTSNEATGEADAEAPVEDWLEPMPLLPEDEAENTFVSTGVSFGQDIYAGVLEIPSLKLSLPVNSECTMAKLRRTPCRYWGSPENNNMVVAAHNYKNHFGRISSLSYGDEIKFTSADGTVYQYEVAEHTVIQPSEVEDMVLTEFDLTLFTCNYDGSERLVVRASIIE